MSAYFKTEIGKQFLKKQLTPKKEGMHYTIDLNDRHLLNVIWYRGIFKDELWLGRWA